MKWLVGTIVLILLVAAGVYSVIVRSDFPGATRGSSDSASATATVSPAAAPESWQYTVLLDVSASRPPAMVAEGERYIETLIDRMNYGDRLLIVPMYEAGVNEAKGDLDLSLAKPSSSLALDETQELTTARNDLKDPVHIFFTRAQTSPVMHTDILTTLSIASEQISDAKRNELIILSDMLQSSKEFEFERLKRMPTPDWVDKRKQEGLIRPLYGACVVAIGADPSTHEGIAVRDFWRKYFEASNATLTLRNYRTTPPSGNRLACE